MSELKPCPFCGGRTIMDASPDLDGYMEYRVECCKVYCLAHGPTRKTRAQRVAFRVAKRREFDAEIRASREEWEEARNNESARDVQRLIDAQNWCAGKWDDYA